MSKKKLSKLLALYLPYVVIGLLATNLGEAWRLAVGKELGDKIVSLMDTLPAAFSNPLPSLHPFDLFIGLCCGAGMRLAVCLKGKNAKKYRHGMEYGSARWGGPKDIEPFMAPKFEDNIILTKTERLKLRSCQHREKILERQMSKLNRRERVHRLCTRAGMLESFLVCPGELTDDQVMELLKISFRQPEVVLALAKMVHDVHERSNVQNPLE